MSEWNTTNTNNIIATGVKATKSLIVPKDSIGLEEGQVRYNSNGAKLEVLDSDGIWKDAGGGEGSNDPRVDEHEQKLNAITPKTDLISIRGGTLAINSANGMMVGAHTNNNGLPVLDRGLLWVHKELESAPIVLDDCSTLYISLYIKSSTPKNRGYQGKIVFGGSEFAIDNGTQNKYDSAYILMHWPGTYSSVSKPANLEFWTTPEWKRVPEFRMIINANGNVGIGTQSPADRLHVVGNTQVTSRLKVGSLQLDTPNEVGFLHRGSDGTVTIEELPQSEYDDTDITNRVTTVEGKTTPLTTVGKSIGIGLDEVSSLVPQAQIHVNKSPLPDFWQDTPLHACATIALISYPRGNSTQGYIGKITFGGGKQGHLGEYPGHVHKEAAHIAVRGPNHFNTT